MAIGCEHHLGLVNRKCFECNKSLLNFIQQKAEVGLCDICKQPDVYFFKIAALNIKVCRSCRKGYIRTPKEKMIPVNLINKLKYGDIKINDT